MRSRFERNREGVRIAIEDVASHPFRMPKLVAQKAYWLLYKDDDGIWAAESYGNDYFIPGLRRDVLTFAANAVYYGTGMLIIAGALAFAFARDWRRLIVLADVSLRARGAARVLRRPAVPFPGDSAWHRHRRLGDRHALGSSRLDAR